jgi:AcrR family transcriptional regulator
VSTKEKGQETSERIVQAALEVFSEVGYGGARVDEIARQAGVNKATLYYHIGDKKALYAAVLHSVIGHTAERIEKELGPDTLPPVEKIRAYIRGFAHAIERNPQVAPIMMRELASGGKTLPDVVTQDFARIITIVTAIIEEGYKTGVFIKVTPFIIHMMVAGCLVFYRATAPVRSKQPYVPKEIKALDLNISDRVVGEIESLILNAIMKKN